MDAFIVRGRYVNRYTSKQGCCPHVYLFPCLLFYSFQLNSHFVCCFEPKRFVQRSARVARLQCNRANFVCATPFDDYLHQSSRQTLPPKTWFDVDVHHVRALSGLIARRRRKIFDAQARARDNRSVFVRDKPSAINILCQRVSDPPRKLCVHRIEIGGCAHAHILKHRAAMMRDDRRIGWRCGAKCKCWCRHTIDR